MAEMTDAASRKGQPELHLHVPLERRDSLNAEDAIQGELFSASNDEEQTRGYRGTVASKVAGITYRQLDYWARKQIVEPSIKPSHGSGSRRLYSFKDVVILAISKKLLDAGVNLQNVTRAIEFLIQHSASRLETLTIMCDGESVHECDSAESMSAFMSSGSAVFGLSVDKVWHQIHDALDNEDYVDLTHTRQTRTQGRPIDELTTMRVRRQLERHRQERAVAA
ncbi:MerR family transcriptional regulator [Bifidobacterium aquikefiricola]|uniref:MerR family transcriptional regulator n=1 Tax=Bifidobacterium aquikefiricola TaxID=3059038 RepID=A0AB39U421_9BIFI